MRAAAYVAAAAAGAIVATLGEEPLWLAAVVALIVFPLAAAAADRESRPERRRRRTPLLPALAAALSGGLLVALLIRLALAAPGWVGESTVGCGGPYSGSERLLLFAAALAFAAATLPVAITLLRLAPFGPARTEDSPPVPLRYYPLAVAASGLALIVASYATNC